MKKLFLLPTILLPYLVCLYFSTFPIGLKLFAENIEIWNLIRGIISRVIVIDLLAGILCNVLYMIFARKLHPDQVLRDALFLKVCHVAPYVLIFLICLLMLPMAFMTFPLLLILFLLDLIFLALSNMVSLYALIRSLIHGERRLLKVVTLICQFFFCADVISLFVANLAVASAKTANQPPR